MQAGIIFDILFKHYGTWLSILVTLGGIGTGCRIETTCIRGGDGNGGEYIVEWIISPRDGIWVRRFTNDYGFVARRSTQVGRYRVSNKFNGFMENGNDDIHHKYNKNVSYDIYDEV